MISRARRKNFWPRSVSIRIFPARLVNLAMIQEQTGRRADALDNLRRALVLMPQWVHAPGPYISLAQNLDHLGAVDLRETALKEAAGLPDGASAVARERAEIAIGHQDYVAAEIQSRSATASNPQDPESWALLAVALERQGKIADATDMCRKALALKPDQDLKDVLQKMLVRLGAY